MLVEGGMKILYILSSNVMGGATISFINLIINLKKKDIIPVVVFPSHFCKGEFDVLLAQHNIEFHRVLLYDSVLPSFTLKKSLKWLVKFIVLFFQKNISALKLSKIIHRINPDIIHTNVGTIHEGFHLAKKYNIPHVWHIREYQTEDFNWYIYPSYKRFCSYLRDSYVITITESLKTFFKLNDSIKAFTIYNGIFRKDEQVERLPKENYFLMASRISPEKGHHDAITAFASFSRKNDYRLVIAGFGIDSYIEELKALAKKYNCEDRIDFIGFHSDVKPLIVKAKALIVASYSEGFGRMTAEAAFCETLVIGRNTAGTKEIIDMTGGLRFLTVEEMSAQMEEIASMPAEEYNNWVQRAHSAAINNYSIENNVNKICELYRSIVS